MPEMGLGQDARQAKIVPGSASCKYAITKHIFLLYDWQGACKSSRRKGGRKPTEWDGRHPKEITDLEKGFDMADRKVLQTSGLNATFEIEVKDRDQKVKTTFVFCKDSGSFKSYVAALSERDSELVYGLALNMADLKARAAARESVAAESTFIVRDGERRDIMLQPLPKLIRAVNNAFALAADEDCKPQGAYIAARKRLLAEGKATEKNGELLATA